MLGVNPMPELERKSSKVAADNAHALAVLKAAPGLYAWQAPDRPEDLAFYDAGGEVWLGSVAYERMAFFGPAAP